METDSGKEMHPTTVKKYGKSIDYHGLIYRFPRALRAVARVSAFGNKKHGREEDLESTDTIFTVPNAHLIYKDCLMRHVIDRVIEGEINEADGGVYHAAQIAWNALCDLEIMLREQEDREAPPKPGEIMEIDPAEYPLRFVNAPTHPHADFATDEAEAHFHEVRHTRDHDRPGFVRDI
jgi:hypothetical protein